MSNTSQVRVGQVVHGYRIDGILGTGGLSEVFAATHLALGKRFAIKTVYNQDDYQRALLLREGRNLRLVHHPALVRLYETFIEGDEVFIVLELVQNATPLRQWQEGRPVAEVLELYAELAEGVAAIHAHGLVHRDLKPQNVLVLQRSADDGSSPAFRPIIMDLGLAVATGEQDKLTGVGTTMGTPLYMSPEAIRGWVLGPGVDVYSLGVMLVEALHGRRSLDPGGGITGILTSRLKGDFPQQRWLAQLQPRELGATIRSMVAVDPADRIDAAELARLLRKIALELCDTANQTGALWSLRGASVRLPSLRERALSSSEPSVAARISSMAALLLALITIWGLVDLSLASTHLLDRQREVWLVTGLAGSALLVVAFSRAWQRKARTVLSRAGDESLARRLIAIEEKVQTSAAMTQSLAVGLQEVSRQVDEKRLTELVRASVVLALQDVETARKVPPGKVAGIVAALQKAAGGPNAEPLALAKRILTYVGIAGGSVAVLAGVAGLLNTTDLWHPGRVPQIGAFGPPELRLKKGAPTFLTVAASDSDGGTLTYSFRASTGRVEGRGNSVLWTPPADLRERIVELTVAVRNKAGVTEQSRSLLVNSPPIVKLDVPENATVGSVVQLRGSIQDADGDSTKVTWRVSCGELLQESGESVFWRTPSRPCHATGFCEADDGWDKQGRTTNVEVK